MVTVASAPTPNNFATASMGEPKRLLLTRPQYYLLHEAGMLPDRCELINGEIREKMPQNGPHIVGLRNTLKILNTLFGSDFVFSQTPLILDANNEPEPDIFVTSLPDNHYMDGKPTGSDVRLVIEVSNTTLRYDLDTKATQYAIAGIPEYWVLDVENRRLWIHRQPTAGAYTPPVILDETQNIAPLSLVNTVIAVKDLLP